MVIPHPSEAIVAGALVLLVAIGVLALVAAARRRRDHRHAAR
ncbi:hypothetical protein WDZ17_05405 [Pseudokineococcus basanitobsidens]|uniref:LPXTG cell wall anchor domain-containing protein n=1 Tax=Pseudokineococcus basanitobsidens TaxID=1926649 RepID=A0ABU8RI69_9ACTN